MPSRGMPFGVSYVQSVLNLKMVHARHAIGKDVYVVVVLQQIQCGLKHAHVRLSDKEEEKDVECRFCFLVVRD